MATLSASIAYVPVASAAAAAGTNSHSTIVTPNTRQVACNPSSLLQARVYYDGPQGEQEVLCFDGSGSQQWWYVDQGNIDGIVTQHTYGTAISGASCERTTHWKPGQVVGAYDRFLCRVWVASPAQP